MRRKNRPKDSVADALCSSFVLRPQLDAVQPWIHINCRGSVEIENCRRVLDYGPRRIRLEMGAGSVTLEGEDLVILSLNAHVTEVRGRLFRLSFGQTDDAPQNRQPEEKP